MKILSRLRVRELKSDILLQLSLAKCCQMSDHHIEMDYQSVHHHYNSEVYAKVGSGKYYVSPILILDCV